MICMRRFIILLLFLVLLSFCFLLGINIVNQQRARSSEPGSGPPPSLPPIPPLGNSTFVFPDAESAEIFIRQNGLKASVPKIKGLTVIYVAFAFDSQTNKLRWYNIDMLQDKDIPAYKAALKVEINEDPDEVKNKIRREVPFISISKGVEGEVKELMEKLWKAHFRSQYPLYPLSSSVIVDYSLALNRPLIFNESYKPVIEGPQNKCEFLDIYGSIGKLCSPIIWMKCFPTLNKTNCTSISGEKCLCTIFPNSAGIFILGYEKYGADAIIQVYLDSQSTENAKDVTVEIAKQIVRGLGG